MKKFSKLLAVFLSAIIITQSYTAVAFAADQPQADSQTANSSVEAPRVPTDGTASADPQIIAEVTEKRTENTKTFLMDDGTYLLASYNEPIHYKDRGGAWQDIDNTLSTVNSPSPQKTFNSFDTSNVSSQSSDSSNSYDPLNSSAITVKPVIENKAGTTKFDFAKTLKSGNAITLNTGAYSLHWGLDGANTVSAQVVQDQTDTSAESHNDQFLKLKKLHSKVEYKDALPGVDIQYITSSGSVKENLILNNKDTQKQFTETYQIGSMTAKQVDDKTIQLFGKSDSQQKNPVYTITAPVMTDASSQFSDAVSISILKQDSAAGTLQIALNTDEAWLNDASRAYPVTVDPNVWTKQDTSYIRDTFVASGSGYHNVAGLNNTMGTMYIGNESSNYKTCRILLNFNLPQLSKGDMVVGANLLLSQYPNGLSPSSATMRINAYQLLSSWNENTVTWDNSKSMMDSAMSKQIVDYANVSQSTNYNTWDISKIVKSWYGGAANDGILLAAENEAALARNVYVASNYPNEQGAYPIMSIQYVNNAGLEDYWTFHNQSAGQIGTSSVNDYTGNLVFAAPVTSPGKSCREQMTGREFLLPLQSRQIQPVQKYTVDSAMQTGLPGLTVCSWNWEASQIFITFSTTEISATVPITSR